MFFFSFFFFKQKTAYEMRISDWSSDVCSSDLVTAAMLSIAASALRSARRSRIYYAATGLPNRRALDEILSDKAGCSLIALRIANHGEEIGRASCRERVCQYV